MQYREQQPAPALQPYLECIWTLRAQAGAARSERILPDGCMELVVNAGDPVRREHATGGCEWQPRIMLVGQMTQPVVIQPGRRIDLAGVRFRPHGGRALLGLPVSELTGGMQALGALLPRLETELQATTQHALSPASRRGFVQDALLRHVRRRATPPDEAMRAAVDAMVRAAGAVRIDALGDLLGLSTRAFERRFRAEVGLSPKLFARLQRFQGVFRAVDRGDPAWARVAVRCGYYDQSHLIRDFRAFAGEPPGCLFARDIPFTHLFTRAGRPAHSSYTFGLA